MKQIYLFLLIVFLIQPCSFSQQQKYQPVKVFTKSEDIIKASIESHNLKKNNDPGKTIVKTTVRDDGYVLVSTLSQYWDGIKYLNSGMVLYTYNPEGLKVEEIDQNWDEILNWVNYRRFLTTYHTNQLISLYEEQNWNGTTWENTYTYVSEYDANNKLIEYDVMQWNGSGWDYITKTTYTYNNSGNVETITDLSSNGTSLENSYKYTFSYNSNDNVSEKITEMWIDGSWTNSIKDVYTYNSENQLHLAASYWWPSSYWKESVEIYYGYDNYGNVNDLVTKFWESDLLGLQNKYHTSYEFISGTSIKTKNENQEWDLQSGIWVNTWREINSYNESNVIENYLTEVWDGSGWIPAFREDYGYDENGNLDSLIAKSWSGIEWTNSYRALNTWLYMLPVELSSFNLNINGSDVTLNWVTATESNNHRFEIERAKKGGKFSIIGFVPGRGTTTQPENYSFTDTEVPAGNYIYRLKQYDLDGSFEYSYEIEAAVSLPLEYSLGQNYPNPFNPATKINFSIPNSVNVSLKIFDITGTEVATLINEKREAGNYTINFDASSLTSGVYFYLLKAGKFTETKKMVVIK